VLYVAKTVSRRFRRTRRPRVSKKRGARIVLGEQLKPDDTSSDLLSEAEALARRGELRAAIRKAYIALLVELGDRKVITLEQHKTNRDYLNSVRSIPLLHSTMRGLTDSMLMVSRLKGLVPALLAGRPSGRASSSGAKPSLR